ncbi:putative mannitol dehydrogenase [Vitis vinifera]|uniref:Putative mannitol dehydrogenase n=1 Tax=Vitis vinifera TaxID=29760 RepID=A0A438GS93_VITVI|nr:putative mannitol dehydrogenase [Vitis vinifera]
MEASQEKVQSDHKAFGWAATDSSGLLSPFHFARRSNGDDDITMRILYCGICHTDLGMLRNHHGISLYPLVHKFKVGDKAGVGTMIGSCGACQNCQDDLESYCPSMTTTYTMFSPDGSINYGGFSDILVVNEHFAVRFPDNLSPEGGAPLLCAGITVYSPMKHFGLTQPGMHLGVVGLGGLGHVAVKFAKAFGMKVTVISTSLAKKNAALAELGADSFLVSHDSEQMQAALGTMDGIIDTVSAPHALKPLIELLKRDGKLIMLGAPDMEKPTDLPLYSLFVGRKVISASMTGGMRETQEMMEFAGKHNISADVEVISMADVNTAMERLTKGDVKYRFVIDIANSLATN